MTPSTRQAVDYLRGRIPDGIDAVLELGSGMGALMEAMEVEDRVTFSEIPCFPATTVAGHSGAYLFGRLAGIPTVVQTGRFHVYEGKSLEEVLLPAQVLFELGARTFVLTNAAGGIRRDLQPGKLMLISDHLDLLWRRLPIGWTRAEGLRGGGGARQCFDPGLNTLIQRGAQRVGVELGEGTYAVMAGPNYETHAEIRMLEMMGADAVGMSTVPTVLAMTEAGARCAAISLITNHAAGLSDDVPKHEDVLVTVEQAGQRLASLLMAVWEEMADDSDDVGNG